MNFSVLPSLIALAILVAVFWAILREGSSERLHLWLMGWVLVLLHFVAQFLDVGQGLRHRVMSAVSLDALQLATIAFLISVSPVANTRRRQILLAAVVGVPALLYTDALVWEVTSRIFYGAVIVLGFSGVALLVWNYYLKITAYVVGLLAGCLGLCCAILWAVARSRFEVGLILILCGLNLAVAVLYWRRFRRATAGVFTTVFGFVAWGAVFPTRSLLGTFAPSVHVQSEVWNIPKYFVAVGMIVTLLEDQIQRSEYLAYHDELTGLPNLRLLLDRMQQSLAHAERTGKKVAVLLLDLDNFKEVNDTFGHLVGDLLLQQTVARLSSRMRASDTVSRSGGDEFTVISEVSDLAGAEILVSALKDALIVPFKLQGQLIRASVSIGLAMYPDDGRDVDALRAAADKAMYAAKRASRNAANSLAVFQHPG